MLDLEWLLRFNKWANRKMSDERSNNPPARQSDSGLISAAFYGPLPPPNLVAGYENVSPGAAERIIKMAEKEAEHQKPAMQDADKFLRSS
jgi:uncharacterized membrane protein